MIDNPILGFIGGGNMTRAIVGGLVADGYPQSRIWVSDPAEEQREAIREVAPDASIVADNPLALKRAEMAVIAVKPHIVKGVARDLADAAQRKRPLIVSIAAGVRAADIDRWLGGGLSLVRVMPNQAALVGQGVAALYANERCTDADRAHAEGVMSAVGETIWVESEALVDAATAISGSGPAYFFLLMEMLMDAALEFGLSEAAARTLVLDTAAGAAAVAAVADEPVATLRERVTSSQGTTEAAIETLERGGVRELFARAFAAARDRSVALADHAGED
jgi:pyrroline-5-carboxylate reductase